jgi:hypothetical protein
MALLKKNMFVDYKFEEVKSRMIEQQAFIPGKENGIILKPVTLGRIVSQTEVELHNGTWNRTSTPQINTAMLPIVKEWQKENLINAGFFDFFTVPNFKNEKITFELVFFPNSFIERLLKYADTKTGVRFRKSHCLWNGKTYQNLISEVYPNGFVTASINSPFVQGENIADYNYGFACPPKWQ